VIDNVLAMCVNRRRVEARLGEIGPLAGAVERTTARRRVRLRDRDDLDLLARFAAVDATARANLCTACAGAVRPYFDRALGGRHDAEDATQEVVVRVLEALPRFRPGGVAFRGWLFTIAHNVAIDRARRAVHNAVATAPADLVRAQDAAPAPGSRGGDAGRDSFSELIRGLPHLQQQAVTLVYLHDLTCEEAARALGRSPASVRKLVERARGYLRANVAVDGELWA
jgi:RNA polymerase sigma-70 factor (ECF subfamily)